MDFRPDWAANARALIDANASVEVDRSDRTALCREVADLLHSYGIPG